VLLLVDGNNLWMRAFHATRHEAMTVGDESTASLVVFTNTLLRHIREEKPDRVVVCWDGGKSAYRSRLLPSYKANRTAGTSERAKAERGLIKQLLSLAGVFHVERPGVEADDLIAKYWHDAEEKIVLVSEDKDFLQLAGHPPRGGPHREIECEILRSTGERWKEFDVFQKTGVWPKDIPSVMALTGDTSDNVPGVPGIGPKKAVQLLEEAGWSLEAIEHPDVAQMRSQVLRNRVLVNLRLPLPGLELPSPPLFTPTGRDGALFDELIAFLEQYRLKGLLARALSGTLWIDVTEGS
jgi:DNA polymerase-1